MKWKDEEKRYEDAMSLCIEQDNLDKALTSAEEAFSLICKDRMLEDDFKLIGAWLADDYMIEVFKTGDQYVLNYDSEWPKTKQIWKQFVISEKEALQIKDNYSFAEQVLETYLKRQQ